MPLNLLCYPVVSKVDVGVMAVEADPSHQDTFCYCETGGTRRAVWQNGV